MIGRTVWLASYPKSGNTWFRAVYTALTADRSADRLDPNRLTTDMIASARARLDSALGIVSSLLRPDESDTMREIADEVLDRPMNERDTAVHLCKIHDAYRTLPGTGSAIVSTRATRHAIYIVRDPRDVAVSLAHHDGITPAQAVCRLADPDAMLGRHRDGVDRQLRQVTGSWSDHVLSWVDDAPFPVHVVRYEDALDDPVGTFGTAFRIVGIDVEDDRLEAAVAAASFDRLEAAERAAGFRERPANMTAFFRRGGTGGWTTDLPAASAMEIEAAHGEVMRRFGYL
jgi:hypothetical protein